MASAVTDAPGAQHHFTFDESVAGLRVDQAVARSLPGVSRTRIQRWITSGDVMVNGEKVLSSYAVKPGDVAIVTEPAPEAGPVTQEIELDVKFEDDDVLVVNKPAGMAVHPGKGISEGTLVNALLARSHPLSSIGGDQRPGIVHRLDKDTTGLLMVAKTDFAHKVLADALQRREVSRRYVALALRNFQEDQGTIDAPICRDPRNRLRMTVGEGPDSRPSRTHWRIIERFRGLAEIECKLESGRMHQIRVHLAHINHPVLGDTTYGGQADLATQLISPHDTSLRAALKAVSRQMLHAHDLRFKHPRSGELIHIQEAPPEDYQEIRERLRQAGS